MYELQEKSSNNIYDPARWSPEQGITHVTVSEKELNSEMPKLLLNLVDTQTVDWQQRVHSMKRL